METNPSPPNRHPEGDRDLDSTPGGKQGPRLHARRDGPLEHGRRGLGTRRPASHTRRARTGQAPECLCRTEPRKRRGSPLGDTGRLRREAQQGLRQEATQGHRLAAGRVSGTHAARASPRRRRRRLPPPAPRPRPGHWGPHPLRGLDSGSCSARLPRGGSCPTAAAGAAGAWPAEGVSGVGPWGRLRRDRSGEGAVRGARGPRRWAPGSRREAPRGGGAGGNAAGAHGAWRCVDRGSGARARAGLRGALALTCSGRVGAARLPSCRSRRSPAPDHVPGPSPSPAFPHPLVRPPPLAPPDSRALPPFPLPRDVRPPREQEPKGKEVRTGATAADLEERWTLGGWDPGARVSSPTVLGEPGAHVALR